VPVVVLSCVALNGLAARGSRLLGHLPGTGDHQVWLSGARACAESSHEEDNRSGL
jgi:hypothetical protein